MLISRGKVDFLNRFIFGIDLPNTYSLYKRRLKFCESHNSSLSNTIPNKPLIETLFKLNMFFLPPPGIRTFDGLMVSELYKQSHCQATRN